jgi:hypothetical protein
VGATRIQAVGSRADLNDPHWVPPLLVSERERFDPKKNPFFEHARLNLFLEERIAAIDDDNHNETHDDNLLFFGFFEAEDEEAGKALLARVEERARKLGREVIHGPANPSLNHNAGLLIDAFDSYPYLKMPYDPPEYPRYVEALGYGKVKDPTSAPSPGATNGAKPTGRSRITGR